MHAVTGLMPAGGRAQRLGRLPCSKEIFPIESTRWESDGTTPRGVCEHLLRSMGLAGVERVYCILREGKWDIPSYLGDGSQLGVRMAYLMMDHPYGVPFTLDQAYPFVRDDTIVVGFPDILFEPASAFEALLEKRSGADVVLGLFPADRPADADMVDVDAGGRVRSIQIKPPRTRLTHAWTLAVWKPSFTAFMHAHLQDRLEVEQDLYEKGTGELHLGAVFVAALEHGMRIESVTFPNGRYLDIGNPSNLGRALAGRW